MILCLVGVIFTLHFVFVLNFGYPLNKQSKTKFDFYSDDYCYPYFYQDWRLFTPCPDSNFKIYVTFNADGKQLYEQPLLETLKYGSLFKGKEFYTLAFTAASGYIGHEAGDVPNGITYFKIEKNYYIFQTLIKNYLNHTHHTKIMDLKMMLVLKNIKTNKQRILIDK